MMTQTASELLKELRGARTQREIADALGVTDRAVSSWEAGTARPSRERASELDDLLEAGGRIVDAFNRATVRTSARPKAASVSRRDEVLELMRRVDERLAALEARLDALDRRNGTS
jgi:transcriptional regulator with XRE-family HTH domain